MPDRLLQVTLINNSSFPVVWIDDGKKWGEWQDPWYPSKLQTLAPGKQGTFRMESDGLWAGVEGWAYFRVDVPYAANVGDRTEFFTLSWDRPYWGSLHPSIEQTRPNSTQPHHVLVRDRAIRPLESGDPVVDVVLGLYVPLSLVPTFLSDAAHNHVWWQVEVIDSAAVSTLQPLQASEPGMADQPFVAVTDIDAAPERIWEALVRPELTVKYWYEARVESPWTVGSRVTFIHKDSDRANQSGVVLECVAPRSLAYTIKSEPCEDCKDSRISFTLEPVGRGVRLTVIHDQLQATTRGSRTLHETWRAILSSLKGMAERGDLPLKNS